MARKLNPKQELFCKLYASDREFFGNGTQSYIEAYDINLSRPGAYASAQASAYKLLLNTHILERIDEYLDEIYINDQHIDKQLGYWATQKASPQAAVSAIREYNKLKQRITEKVENRVVLPAAILGGEDAIRSNDSNQKDNPN